MSLRCTTHFHACDCREEKFKLLEQRLKEAEEVIGFYANKSMWGYNEKPKDQSHLAWMIERNDCGYCQDNEKFVGGKRARAYFKKYGEKEEGK